MVCFSLLVACAGLSAVLLINQGAKQSYSGQTAVRILPAHHQIVARDDTQAISTKDYADIKAQGLQKAVAIAESSRHLYLEKKRITQRRATLIGIDFLALLNQSKMSNSAEGLQALNTTETQPRIDLSGNISFASPLALIHPSYMQELGLDKHSSLTIDEASTISVPPLSPMSLDGMSDGLIVDIGILLDIDSEAKISRILLLEGTRETQIESLKQTLPTHLQLESITAQQNNPQMTQSFYLNLFAMALLMFAVCLFIVMNAFNLLIFKRFAMLKVFRQLGIGRQQIILAHAIEFSVFALIISAVSIVVGAQLAVLASSSIRTIVEGLYRVQVGFADTTWLSLYIKVLLISMTGIALALLAPLKQLKQSLSKTQSDNNDSRLNVVLTIMCAVLAALALLIFSVSSNLSLLLIGAAMVILSGCCALIVVFPQCLKALFKLIPANLTLTRLSVAQALFLSRKTKIACCAFFIAATSNLGMNLMVDSFRASTEGWLSQRLVADHYLYSNDAASNRQLTTIATQAGVQLYPRYEQNIEHNGRPAQLFSYPIDAKFKQAMVFASNTEAVWQDFEAAQSVLINQQLAIRSDLAINDSVTFIHPTTGLSSSFKVGGVIYDYGNPYGQILLSATEFNQDISQSSIFAVLGNSEQIAKFTAALETIGIVSKDQLYQTSDILSGSMEIFDRTFVITDSLNLVTLMVAALSLACTIVILLEQSRPQTMLLRAMGISAWQSRRILLQQYLFLCTVALIAATPFGVLLSYVLIEQINYHAFNWSYPLVIDWLNIIKLYGLSLFIVVLVISLPIVYTTKQSLAQELKWLD